MTLSEDHSLTSPSPRIESSISLFGSESIPAGTYDGGLFTIIDDLAGPRMLSSWRWLKRDMTAILSTSFGDLFFWDHSSSEIYFLDVQRGTVEFVDDEVTWFLNSFLENSEVMDKVLRHPRFLKVKERLGSLDYHDAFLLEPWALLGGADEDDRYVIGSCPVYLDLFGQTHAQIKPPDRFPGR